MQPVFEDIRDSNDSLSPDIVRGEFLSVPSGANYLRVRLPMAFSREHGALGYFTGSRAIG